jgi:1,4-dihydroxy-2-naphthoate octaprenyltransferase
VRTRETTEIVPGRSLRQTLSAYARLSNLAVYFQWIPALVAWSLSQRPFGLSGDGLLALLVFVLACIAMACSAGTLDDITGLRDGLDQRAYAGDDALRGISGKPLVSGEIRERAARRFAFVVGMGGLMLGVLALLLAPHHPLWLFLLWLVAACASTQYSYGVKLSYHGAGELLLGLEAAAVLAVPLVFIDGGVSRAGWFEAFLVAALFAQVTVFSSSQDADVDRAAGRMTPAARLSPAGNRRFIAAVFLAGWAVTAAGLLSGALDRWLLLACAPMWMLQGAQLVNGLSRERWLLARLLGWRAFDAGVLALVAVNLLAR